MVVTFVTSSDVKLCAEVLDNKRLGKQRVEAKQILDVVMGTSTSKGWKSHPAALMWMGYEDALKVYINTMIDKWVERGFKNTMIKYDVKTDINWPWWFSWEDLHLSHKCSLLRKNPKHYGPLWQLEGRDKSFLEHGYIWATHLDDKKIVDIRAGKFFDPQEICDPIGAGAPAEYRWKKEEVEQWINNKTVNPKTGKKIKPCGKTGIAADIRKAAVHYGLTITE